MRRTTNLHWPIEPFGATQRPFAADRPMMAAVSVGWTGHVRRPAWACVVYLYTDSTRTLALDGQVLNFGYEVLTSQPGESTTALVERLDEVLVACRRHAKVLAGHDLARDLATLTTCGLGRRLPGVDGVRQQWTARQAKERGMAAVIDTAHDIAQPDATDLALLCDQAELTAIRVTVPAGTADAATVRQAIVHTLAIALLAARATGKYDWTTPVDLDQLVTETAWDQLAQLTSDIECALTQPGGSSAAG